MYRVCSSDGLRGRALRLPVALLLACGLVGCGSIGPLKLHSEVRQKQGEDLVKAWKEVDLKPLFEADRANLANLRQAEVDGWNRHLQGIYQAELRELARMPAGDYRATYAKALEALAGPEADARAPLSTAMTALRQEKTAKLELARTQALLRSLRVPAFSCQQLLTKKQIVEDWKAKEPQLAADVARELKDSAQFCADIAKAQKDYVDSVGKLRGGALKLRVAGWHADQQDLLKRQAEVDDALIEVNKAQKAYDAALVKGQPPSEAAKQKAEDLAKAIAQLAKVQAALGVELASKERIERIDALLKSIQEGKELSADSASKLEVAISLFPKIADSLKAVKDSKASAAVPLLIQRDVEQARLSTAQVEVARLKQSVELRAAVVLASLLQAESMLAAIDSMDNVTDDGKQLLGNAAAAAAQERKAARAVIDNSQSTKAQIDAARAMRDKQEAATLEGVWPKLPPTDRFFVLEGATRYLDVHARLEGPVTTAETTRRALAMDRNVDLSEVNTALWTALIGSSVTQAAEYSTLGFKAADFEWLLNFLALGYIGHGVNK